MKLKPIQDPNIRLAEVIDREAPADRIVTALADALAADLVNRDGSRGPDHRTRVSAALALLQYRIGRPVERQEIISVNLDADSSIGLAERLANSPALLKSLKAVIAKVEDEGSSSRG